MDFTLTADQMFIKDTLRKLLQRECPREKAHALDEQGAYPSEILTKIAEIGFCGLNTPEAFGGFGQDLPGTVIAMEEIAAVSPALAALFASTSLCGGRVISQFGSPTQQQELLSAIAKGVLKFSFALDDELADPRRGLRVTAPGNNHDQKYVLNGSAPYVLFTGAGGADYFLAQAHGDDEPNSISMFIVPRDATGLRIQTMPTVGLRGTGLGELVFEQVQLSPEQVLGEAQQIGQGKAQAEYLTALNQISGAAIGLGIAQSAYLYSLNYARERSQFGQTLLQFEAVDHMLVDMAVGIKSTHWLLYHACWLADQGKPFALEAAMTRLQAGNLARQAGLQSVHILGGYGYMAEYDAQRSMRDALVLFPGSESAEILKTKIGKQLHEHT